MATRFVPAHVRSAIDIVETDHECTTTERDAFARFTDRISDLDDSSVDLHPDHPHQVPVQTLIASKTPSRASRLARVRDAYTATPSWAPPTTRRTTTTPFPRASPRSSASRSPPQSPPTISFTSLLRNRLIEATHDARESRHALLQGLKHEHSALDAANGNLTRLGADLDDVLSAQSFDAWCDERLTRARDYLHGRQQECDQLAANRQDTLHEQRIPSTHHIDHEFTQYLYESLSVTYPVLADITSLVETLRTAHHGVVRALRLRDSGV